MTARAARILLIGAAAAGLLAPPAAAAAQETWVSAWGGIFMDPGTVTDGESGTVWDFGTSVVGGIGVQRRFGQSLLAGVELGYSPMKHEVRAGTGGLLLDEGRATILMPMAVGRLGAGGGAGFTTYLAGGIGAIVYGIPHLDEWDPDLALRAGGGVEYGAQSDLALFLEWNRWWTFHQSEGVDDNTIRHSHLQLGLRYGI